LLDAQINSFELSVIKAVVPDVDTLVTLPDARGSAASLVGEAARQRFIATAIDLFRRTDGVFVLLLEDLHWAVESLDLLRQLINARLPLLIVGSYRDDETPELPDTLPGANVISLKRLNADEIAALSESMLGETGGKQEIVQLLQRETEGNVFFLVETVRALAEEAGELSHIGRLTVPRVVLTGGVQAIVRRRLARVPEWGQSLLKLTAVAGRQVTFPLLTQLGRLVNVTDVEPWIEVTINAVVGEVQGNEWRFAHDKLRQAMLEDLDDDELSALHRQAAEAVEIVYPNSEDHAEDLFYHWREAGDRERELLYLFTAAERALDLTAVYSNALRWLQDSLHRYGDELEAQRRGRILNLLGKAHQHLSEYPAATERYTAALALGIDDISAEARLGLASVDRQTGEPHTAIAYAREALRYYRSVNDRKGIADALERLGAIHIDKGEYESARAVLADVLTIRSELNDLAGIGLAHNMLGNLALYLGEYDTAQGHYERALNLRSAIGDLRGTSATYNNLALIAQDRADYDAAWAYQEESLAIKRRINDRQGIEISLSNLGYLAQLKGDLKQTEQMYLEALSIQREIGDKRGISTTLTDLGTVAMNNDEDDIAELYFGESGRLKAEVEDRQGEAIYVNNYAQFMMVRGEYQQARMLLERGLQLARAIGERFLETYSLFMLGELDELDGQLAAALAKYQQALAISEEIGIPRERGVILLNLARVQSATGNQSAATAALREAIGIVLQLNVPADQHKPLLVAANIAVNRGDWARALALLGCLEAAVLTERTDRFALDLLRKRIDTPARVAYDADYVLGSELDVSAELYRLRDGD
ncbi:MAG: tetratricopeptide repeat protein, partial [Anaerolinea sp.]|nr:tetratricopeptide repeat protein [Anaerolinea sp.]